MSICPRCHYETPKSSTLIDHLKRAKPCPCKFSDETRENIIESFKHKSFACAHCSRVFAGAKCLSRHEKGCTNALLQTIDVLVDKIYALENNDNIGGSRVTINNIQNNNIIIVVNNFGTEDRSYITQEIMQQCLDKMKINPLVDSVYFHPDHPENHTIKLKSEKKKRVILAQDGKWVEGDMNASIDSMMHRENSSLSSYFYENIWPDQSITFENKTWAHKKLLRINDKNKEFFEQRREIQAKLKNVVSS